MNIVRNKISTTYNLVKHNKWHYKSRYESFSVYALPLKLQKKFVSCQQGHSLTQMILICHLSLDFESASKCLMVTGNFSKKKRSLVNAYKIFKGRICPLHCIKSNYSPLFNIILQRIGIWLIIRVKLRVLFKYRLLKAFKNMKLGYMLIMKIQSEQYQCTILLASTNISIFIYGRKSK